MSLDPMTPQQRQALERAWDILSEHFEHVLLVVDADVEVELEGSTELEQWHEGFWHGGALMALGMAEWAKSRIMESGRKSNEPTE